MLTKAEKEHVKMLRQIISDGDNFQLAVGIMLADDAREESSIGQILEAAGIGYRKGRYLIQITQDLERLGYDSDDWSDLIRGLGWTKTSHILNGLTRKRSVKRLIQQYSGKTVPQVKADFPSPKAKGGHSSQKMFAAFLPEAQHKKLIRILKKGYGLVDTGGKKKDVSKAFAQLVNDL